MNFKRMNFLEKIFERKNLESISRHLEEEFQGKELREKHLKGNCSKIAVRREPSKKTVQGNVQKSNSW